MIDDGSRLTRLLQYCVGKARKVIHCCTVMPPSEGYKHARKLLKERFGNKYRISEAWIDKITNGQQIKPHEGESLRDLADDLKSCEATLGAINHLNEVSTQRVFVKIVGRLPRYLEMRWMKEIHEVQNRQHRSANFHDLVLFVDRAAEEVTDSVYSVLTAGKRAARSQQPTEAVAANIFTSPLQGQGGRVACSGSHSVASCEQFKGLDLGSRAKFARQKRLCFNCLKRSHKAESCTVAKRCFIFGCGRKTLATFT